MKMVHESLKQGGLHWVHICSLKLNTFPTTRISKQIDLPSQQEAPPTEHIVLTVCQKVLIIIISSFYTLI